jgi:hypothetical protein
MRLRLWFVRESNAARRYCKLPKTRNPGSDIHGNENYVWIPRSLISHVQQRPSRDGVEWPEHDVQVDDWFAERENL